MGDSQTTWQAYDATALVLAGAEKIPLLIDQGQNNNFLAEQLRPELLQSACQQQNFGVTLRYQAVMIIVIFLSQAFMSEHIAYHAKALTR